jgi:hypothetical protein
VLTGVALLYFPSPATKAGVLVLAGLLFASAWFGFCFINKMLGVNTARRESSG